MSELAIARARLPNYDPTLSLRYKNSVAVLGQGLLRVAPISKEQPKPLPFTFSNHKILVRFPLHLDGGAPRGSSQSWRGEIPILFEGLIERDEAVFPITGHYYRSGRLFDRAGSLLSKATVEHAPLASGTLEDFIESLSPSAYEALASPTPHKPQHGLPTAVSRIENAANMSTI